MRQHQKKMQAKAEAAVNDPLYSADPRIAALAADARYSEEARKELDELLETRT